MTGNLTKDECDNSTFPTTQIHDRIMNAINERTSAEVVAFAVVVMAMGVSMGGMGGVTIMRCLDINDFNPTFGIFAVDRCKDVGSADKR